ncbi:MAG: hypothetical protein ABIT38_11295 [Gemmatimonadaceae bacterium]
MTLIRKDHGAFILVLTEAVQACKGYIPRHFSWLLPARIATRLMNGDREHGVVQQMLSLVSH